MGSSAPWRHPGVAVGAMTIPGTLLDPFSVGAVDNSSMKHQGISGSGTCSGLNGSVSPGISAEQGSSSVYL